MQDDVVASGFDVVDGLPAFSPQRVATRPDPLVEATVLVRGRAHGEPVDAALTVDSRSAVAHLHPGERRVLVIEHGAGDRKGRSAHDDNAFHGLSPVELERLSGLAFEIPCERTTRQLVRASGQLVEHEGPIIVGLREDGAWRSASSAQRLHPEVVAR